MQPRSIPHSRMPQMNDAGLSSPTGVQPILSSSAFSYAHSFSMNHPVLAERININYTQDWPSDYQVLSWLCAHTIRGVEFSSAARDPPPRCHPGTRERLKKEFQEWLDQAKHSPQKVACLYGPAGVGKSAIAQSVAEGAITGRKFLGATLFFDQLPTGQGVSSTHSEPSKLWLTVAYRLATKHPSYLRHIRQTVALDPKLVEQSMEHQFHSLITEPIGVDGLLNASSRTIPIFIDGLDLFDCPRVQEQVMHLILNFARTYPDAPLAWIISFRWEKHLINLLSEHTDFRELIRHVPVPMDSEEAKMDVQVFMRSKFRQMQRQYDIVEPMPWPAEKDLICLFVSTSGFFIFASAIISFCEDRSVANPVSQLEVALPLISYVPGLPREHLEMHPLFPMHVMYRRILEDIYWSPFFSTTTRILGFLLLPNGYGAWTPESTTLWALCNIFGIPQHIAYPCLSKLTVVLSIPSAKDAMHTPIRFLHTSFAHFLLDREVAKEFWIDVRRVVADLWLCHFRALLQTNDLTDRWLPEPSKIHLSWASTSQDEVEFRNEFWENARRMFFHHLLPCPSSSCPSGPHYNELSEGKDLNQFIKMFGSIRFDMLVDGYAFPDLPYKFVTFLDWLFKLPEDHPLQIWISRPTVLLGSGSYIWPRMGICFKIQVECVDDSGCITIFKCYTDKKLHPPRNIDSSRFFSTRETPEPISVLQEELDTPRNFASLTVQESCHILVDTSFPRHKSYYILSEYRRHSHIGSLS